jgi:TRAP-type mannitol/chloroaromatic compound transport system permease large subunit
VPWLLSCLPSDDARVRSAHVQRLVHRLALNVLRDALRLALVLGICIAEIMTAWETAGGGCGGASRRLVTAQAGAS